MFTLIIIFLIVNFVNFLVISKKEMRVVDSSSKFCRLKEVILVETEETL